MSATIIYYGHTHLHNYTYGYTNMYTRTIWFKCLTGGNFDEFDKSKLHCQNFSYQYYNNLSTSTYNIFMAHRECVLIANKQSFS